MNNRHIFKEILNRKYLLLYIMVMLIVCFSLMSKQFLTLSNINFLLMSQVTVGLMALGALCIAIVNEFDLSLGYLIGFIMVLGAKLIKLNCATPLVLIIMIAVGTLVGLINGILCVRFGLSSFIATLAVGILLNGLTLGISNGLIIAGNFPPFILSLGQAYVGKIGLCILIYAFFALVMFYILRYTIYGRQLYAVGGSKAVAFLAGVKTNLISISAFVLAGFFTGIAAVIQLGQSGSAFPDFGSELLMPAYAIVFLSSTVFKPGTFNIPGAVLATILFGIGDNALSILGTSFGLQVSYSGVLLLLSVTASMLLTRRGEKTLGGGK